ncbi:hypothetical protein TTRE_0000110901 [Trichuris trichiura]|uniref:Uncharacterized protein n=1 Tax=Trichuris trichiura TaxID=36087 RepID=A0A077YXM5_TRITR|nr:hypothetical protein TTRE_0000110901 [Trichuris trichiura]
MTTRSRRALLRVVGASWRFRSLNNDAKKNVRIVQMAKQLTDISRCCCGRGCENCVLIQATEDVLNMCADVGTDTCIKLIGENVDDDMARQYLLMCLRMRKNNGASHQR